MNVLNYLKWRLWQFQVDSNSASFAFDFAILSAQIHWTIKGGGFRFRCLSYKNIIIQWAFRIFCNSFSSRRDFVTRKWIHMNCAWMWMCLYLFRAHQIENWSDFPNWNVRKTVPHHFSLSPVTSFFCLLSKWYSFVAKRCVTEYRPLTPTAKKNRHSFRNGSKRNTSDLKLDVFFARTTEKWLPIENDYTCAACASSGSSNAERWI